MSEFKYWRHRWSPQHLTTVDMTGTMNAPQWEPVHVLSDEGLAEVEQAAAEKALTEAADAWHRENTGTAPRMYSWLRARAVELRGDHGDD